MEPSVTSGARVNKYAVPKPEDPHQPKSAQIPKIPKPPAPHAERQSVKSSTKAGPGDTLITLLELCLVQAQPPLLQQSLPQLSFLLVLEGLLYVLPAIAKASKTGVLRGDVRRVEAKMYC